MIALQRQQFFGVDFDGISPMNPSRRIPIMDVLVVGASEACHVDSHGLILAPISTTNWEKAKGSEVLRESLRQIVAGILQDSVEVSKHAQVMEGRVYANVPHLNRKGLAVPAVVDMETDRENYSVAANADFLLRQLIRCSPVHI